MEKSFPITLHLCLSGQSESTLQYKTPHLAILARIVSYNHIYNQKFLVLSMPSIQLHN